MEARRITRHRLRAVTARDVPAIIALALAVGALAYAYMSQESFVYFWDYSNFHGIAVRFADALMADPRAGATMFVDALAQRIQPDLRAAFASRHRAHRRLAARLCRRAGGALSGPVRIGRRRGLPSRLSAIGAGGAVDRHAAGYRRAAGLEDGDARLSRCAWRRGVAGGVGSAARRRAARAVVDGAVDRLRGRRGRRHPPPLGVRQPGRARDRGR